MCELALGYGIHVGDVLREGRREGAGTAQRAPAALPAFTNSVTVRIHKVGIQVGPSTKGGCNVLTLYTRRVARWILRYAQDDK